MSEHNFPNDDENNGSDEEINSPERRRRDNRYRIPVVPPYIRENNNGLGPPDDDVENSITPRRGRENRNAGLFREIMDRHPEWSERRPTLQERVASIRERRSEAEERLHVSRMLAERERRTFEEAEEGARQALLRAQSRLLDPSRRPDAIAPRLSAFPASPQDGTYGRPAVRPRAPYRSLSQRLAERLGSGTLDEVDRIDAPLVPKKKVNVGVGVSSLQSLIDIIDANPLDETIEYNVDMDALHRIKAPLISLKRLIGMENLKDRVLDQVVYYVQGLHKVGGDGDFLHTVITGPPGTGKTEVAKIIGEIFSNLGVLEKGTFKKVTRSDLVAGFLGQTALKTSDVIADAVGGVLFIDEAYSIGSEEKKDSFAKECVDTLCEALSDKKKDLMVIVAGYEDQLETCFFSQNEGLKSRFAWKYETGDYSAEELRDIFLKKVVEAGWGIRDGEDLPVSWFEKNMESFPSFGRDIESLLSKTKISHGRRVFGLPAEERAKLTVADVDAGFALHKGPEDAGNDDDAMCAELQHMYV